MAQVRRTGFSREDVIPDARYLVYVPIREETGTSPAIYRLNELETCSLGGGRQCLTAFMSNAQA